MIQSETNYNEFQRQAMSAIDRAIGSNNANAIRRYTDLAVIYATRAELAKRAAERRVGKLPREDHYVCKIDGYEAIDAGSPENAAKLASFDGWCRVEFRNVWCKPYVCPVNGAEFGDDLYVARLPFRPDGMRLTYRRA